MKLKGQDHERFPSRNSFRLRDQRDTQARKGLQQIGPFDSETVKFENSALDTALITIH